MAAGGTAAAAVAPVRAFDRRLLPPMMLGSILNPINSSIIAVALAPIATALGAPASQTAWLISALYLATSIGQPLVGRLVDIFGPKRMFLIGGVLTGAAGILGTLAPDIWTLVAARVILGFGTCAGYPAAMYLIRSEARRTGMTSPAGVLTALAIATQTIAVIGPSLGGLLIDIGGWRSTLAVNIPLAVACLLLGWFVLPSGNVLRAEGTARPGRVGPSQDAGRAGLDGPGVVLFAATLTALLLFLMNPHLILVWLLAVAILAGTGFALHELRSAEPFIDVRVFAGNLPLLATYARTLLGSTVSYAFIYGFTQWLEVGRGLSASATGLILLPTFGVGILVSALTGRRQAVTAKLVTGGVVQLIACVLLLAVEKGTAVWLLVAIAILVGFPQGLVNLANQNALYHQAQPERIGASSGLLRTFMYLGAMVASSAAGLCFGSRATTGGLHALAIVMLVAAAALLAVTLADQSLRRVATAARVPAPRAGE
ncbi:MAG: MFS transporter [Micromonosporaceae bacterium]|nr:MFS transporter [Micromonosporaceae bacterium]